mmetsp:Transcript_27016/g.63190  ORF Transcript_27016/g.63190 Transcript_27016/m.63190 type:complete len:230 (+) Transcript_27016:788-1477(+)
MHAGIDVVCVWMVVVSSAPPKAQASIVHLVLHECRSVSPGLALPARTVSTECSSHCIALHCIAWQCSSVCDIRSLLRLRLRLHLPLCCLPEPSRHVVDESLDVLFQIGNLQLVKGGEAFVTGWLGRLRQNGLGPSDAGLSCQDPVSRVRPVEQASGGLLLGSRRQAKDILKVLLEELLGLGGPEIGDLVEAGIQQYHEGSHSDRLADFLNDDQFLGTRCHKEGDLGVGG